MSCDRARRHLGPSTIRGGLFSAGPELACSPEKRHQNLNRPRIPTRLARQSCGKENAQVGQARSFYGQVQTRRGPLRANKSKTFDCPKFTRKGAGDRSNGAARTSANLCAFVARGSCYTVACWPCCGGACGGVGRIHGRAKAARLPGELQGADFVSCQTPMRLTRLGIPKAPDL